jgi:hypothetical protein
MHAVGQFRIKPGLPRGVKEIGCERDGVAVLSRDSIKSAEIRAQAKGAILLLDN